MKKLLVSDKKSNITCKYYIDNKYDYGLVLPEILNTERAKFMESEKPVIDKLSEYIGKKGVDSNPYVVKIKIFRK